MTLSWARKDFQVASLLFWEIPGKALHPETVFLPIIVILCALCVWHPDECSCDCGQQWFPRCGCSSHLLKGRFQGPTLGLLNLRGQAWGSAFTY